MVRSKAIFDVSVEEIDILKKCLMNKINDTFSNSPKNKLIAW
jgi:hypothetical protein